MPHAWEQDLEASIFFKNDKSLLCFICSYGVVLSRQSRFRLSDG